MISDIVKNIFWVLFSIFITLVFVAAIIAAAVWLATSGELIIIALIVAYVIGFAAMLALDVISTKQLFDDCREIDKMLKEMQNGKDKG